MLKQTAPKLTREQYEKNFADINPPLTRSQALEEGSRCLFCYDAPCIKACPTEIDVPQFIRQIITDNVSGAAKTILKRVIAIYPGRKFPAPEDLLATPDERLRGAGLSRAKTAALKDIAAKTLEGIVPSSRAIASISNEEILERLAAIRGVGPWTVEMLLIFMLGRLDVLPATDFGVRKGFALTYRRKELPAPSELIKHGERWRPYRTIACWYLWRALDAE